MSSAAIPEASEAPAVEGPVVESQGAVALRSPERPAAMRVPVEGSRGSITELLHLAVEKGTPVEQLKELVALHERLTDRQAAIEFAQAMAAFQKECPPIKKSSDAKIATKGGGSYSYTYAELDEIARTVNPILAKNGLSYSWDCKVEKDTLTCVCTVRHINGHSTSSTFALPVDNPSAMSAQQKVGAAMTFAQRRSLSAVLGLTTTDDDPDAAAQVDPKPIDDDQFTFITDLLAETSANEVRFLKYLGVASVKAIPASRYKEAVAALNEIGQKRQEKAMKMPGGAQ